jgi:hypothetical protein
MGANWRRRGVMPREETFAGAAVAGFFGRIRAATNHASRGGILMRLPSGRAVQLFFGLRTLKSTTESTGMEGFQPPASILFVNSVSLW